MSRLMEDRKRFATPINEALAGELGRNGLRESKERNLACFLFLCVGLGGLVWFESPSSTREGALLSACPDVGTRARETGLSYKLSAIKDQKWNQTSHCPHQHTPPEFIPQIKTSFSFPWVQSKPLGRLLYRQRAHP